MTQLYTLTMISLMVVQGIDKEPLFKSRAEIHVSASPGAVYAIVSDLPRSGEWSPECTGGQWISGTPATVGAVFRGENLRSKDVVAWAPVVRGAWATESQVTVAEPGRTFRWAIRTKAGQPQDSIWAFDIEPDAEGGCVLVHHYRMGEPTEGIRGITAEMDQATRTQFIAEWNAKVALDLAATLERLKVVIEKQ